MIVSAEWANRTFKGLNIDQVAEPGGPIGTSFELLMDTILNRLDLLEKKLNDQS